MRELAARTTTLDNGVRVVTVAMPHHHSVALGVWIGAGTRDERPHEAGLAHFLEHMTFKGTRRRDARQIAEEIEDVGGSLDAHTSREYTAYYARVLPEDVPLALDLVVDLVRHAALDPEELVREREVVLQEIAEVMDAADEWVFELAQEAAFPDQGLGWPILGRRETVAAFDTATTRAFLQRHYTAAHLVVSAAGPVEHARFLEEVAGLLGDLPAGAPAERGAPRWRGGEVRDARELDQLHLVLALQGVGLTHEGHFAQHLFTNILGGGMASRLFQEVRERRGLAYSVFSFAHVYRDTALVGAYAASDPARAGELARVMAEEIARLAREGPTEAELARAIRQAEASLLMGLESCSAVADDSARQQLYFGRRLTLSEILERLRRVTAADVQAVGARLVACPPVVAAVGPDHTLPAFDELARRLTAPTPG